MGVISGCRIEFHWEISNVPLLVFLEGFLVGNCDGEALRGSDGVLVEQ